MFNFMKKGSSSVTDDDKEKRKKEKKQRKEQQKRERASGTMSAEELLRLDEVRRSLKLRGRRKEKLPSGITADYSASFFASLEKDSLNDSTPGNSMNSQPLSLDAVHKGGLTQSDSSEASLNSISNQNTPRQSLPPVPPRPPKRGILKGPRLSLTSLNSDTTDTSNLLLRNTMQNELIGYQNLPIASKIQSFESLAIKNDLMPNNTMTHNDNKLMNNLLVLTSTSPSAESLTSTNSSFATPPFSLSPVGESQGYHRWSKATTFEDVELPLPEIKSLVLPNVRTLTIYRQKGPKNDFGFSLRRAMILERNEFQYNLTNGDSLLCDKIGARSFRGVIFAEPGIVGGPTGLLPGDKLLEVNGVKVDNKTREEVIEMIKSSEEYVIVKVQPIAELSELSSRCLVENLESNENYTNRLNKDDSPSHYESGTLRRSASRRYMTSINSKYV